MPRSLGTRLLLAALVVFTAAACSRGTAAATIVTTIEDGREFYRAEAYHQDFLVRNPSHPDIVINDLPKVAALKRSFADLYRAKPALVGSLD